MVLKLRTVIAVPGSCGIIDELSAVVLLLAGRMVVLHQLRRGTGGRGRGGTHAKGVVSMDCGSHRVLVEMSLLLLLLELVMRMLLLLLLLEEMMMLCLRLVVVDLLHSRVLLLQRVRVQELLLLLLLELVVLTGH